MSSATVRRRDGQQRLLLAGEERASLVEIRVQRLDAEPVPRAEQYPLLRVPDEEREHAPQLAHDLLAQVVVTRDDRLAVAVGLEGRAEVAGQPLAQLQVVVDLAVEDQVVAPQVGERLVAVVDVDDREAAETDHTSWSLHTPPSSGPRCRIWLNDASIAVTLTPRPRRQRRIRSVHTHRPVFPSASADGGRYSWACRRPLSPAHEFVVPHLAPRRDIGARGRIVGLDRDRRSDRACRISPGQVDDR